MPPRRRTSTAKRATASRKTAPKKKPPANDTPIPGPGERLYVLDVPYGDKAPGARWSKTAKAHLYVGPANRPLPPALAAYRPGPYTLGRFTEHLLNGTRPPEAKGNGTMTPRPHQIEGAQAIARRAATGGGMFLLGDEPGVGKTLTAILAARTIATLHKSQTILVVADRPASITIGHWARSIAAIGDGGLTWVVTTWDRLAKVEDHKWDIVLADEVHAVRWTTTKRWKAWSRIAGLNPSSRHRPFVLAASATPGHSPLELPYLSPIYAEATRTPLSDWLTAREPLATFAAQLSAQGIGVNPKGRYGPEWTDDPHQRQADLAQVRRWLEGQKPPAMLARPAPWGPVPVHGLPVALTPHELAQYEAEWGEFCAEMRLARSGNSTARGRAALLRFRQKAGLIRVDSTVEWIKAQVDNGRQVACSVEFVSTAADPITERLMDSGIHVARIYGGAETFDRENERLAFQRGKAPVCVFTITASISLHAGETLSGVERATTIPRVGIFHQARYSGIAGRQITGRTHRDHQVSPWSIAYAAGTVEEQVGKVMVERIAAAADTVGGDTSTLARIAGLLGADWLPSTVLTEEGP